MTTYRVTVQPSQASWTFQDARELSDIVADFRDRLFVPGVAFDVAPIHPTAA